MSLQRLSQNLASGHLFNKSNLDLNFRGLDDLQFYWQPLVFQKTSKLETEIYNFRFGRGLCVPDRLDFVYGSRAQSMVSKFKQKRSLGLFLF